MPVQKWMWAAFLLGAGLPVLATPVAPPDQPQQQYAVSTSHDRLGRLLAPVYINGRGPFRFLIDTGSTGTFVGSRLARELGIAPPDKNPQLMRIHDVMGTIDAPAIHVTRLDLGPFVETDLTLPSLPIEDLSGANGVLGVEGLRGRQLSVDFRRDIITIDDGGQYIPARFDRLQAEIQKGSLMVVSIRISDVEAPTLIDTGAETTVINLAMLKAIRAAGERPLPIKETTLINLFGTKVPGTFYLVDDVKIAGYRLDHLPVAVVSSELFESWGYPDTPAIVLGMDVLGLADGLVLDYRNAELYVGFPTIKSNYRLH